MTELLIQLLALGASAVYIVGTMNGRLDGIERRLSSLEKRSG